MGSAPLGVMCGEQARIYPFFQEKIKGNAPNFKKNKKKLKKIKKVEKVGSKQLDGIFVS